jgi:hypothetical protein
MDETMLPAAAPEPGAGDGQPQNGERQRPADADVAMPPPPAPPGSPRRVPVWAMGVGGLVAALIAFGSGYAVTAGEADAVRDDLNAEIDRSDEEIEGLEGSRAAAEARLDQCQDAVEGAAALTAAADDLAADWQKAQSLMAQYLAVPVGSAEEARIDAMLVEIEAQMSGKFGALSASAVRVTTDSKSCRAA